MKLKILIAAAVVLLVIQWLPIGGSAENPPITSEPRWASQKTRELFMRACGNCHSHETQWPWYSKVAPVSWFIRYHVNDGRRHFNVSRWQEQKKNKGSEAAEELQEGSMPPTSYLWLHPEARLTAAEKQLLIEGLKATFPPEKLQWVD